MDTLARAGYTGRVYLVVDDEDPTLDRYRANFGDERVVVFDKRAEADSCDEGNNFDERRTILMARNACFAIAARLCVTHFLQLDDDYYYFGRRLDDGARVIRNFDLVVLSVLEFFRSTGTTSVAFAQGGDHIGGYSGLKLKRKAMNSFFCSTDRPFRFVGAMNDDVNTYTTLGCRGHLFFTFTGLQLDQADTQSQTGGITAMYDRFGTYCKSFTSVMMMPSAVSVGMMRSKNPRLHHIVNWGRCVPCIVPERFRANGDGIAPATRKGEG